MNVVAWLGPAAPFQAPGWTPPDGAKVLNLQCKGDGSPPCSTIAELWTDEAGRKIPNMLRAGGVSPETVGEVMLNAFSAGGSSTKRLLLSAEDRAQVPVVVLCDGTYTSWRKKGEPDPPEGFVRYGLDAITGPRLFVAMSTSVPNKDQPNGSQTLEATKNEIEKRSGQKFEEGGTLPGVPIQPERLWRLGNIVFADYGKRVGHGDTVSKLATPVWETIVKPWLVTRAPAPPVPGPLPGPVPEEPSQWPFYVAMAVGALAGYVGTRYWQKQKRPA